MQIGAQVSMHTRLAAKLSMFSTVTKQSTIYTCLNVLCLKNIDSSKAVHGRLY